MKNWKTLAVAGAMTLTALAGCSSGSEGGAADSGDSGKKGSVYYLNFKPEQNDAWQELAKKYTEETGVEVTVVTAASGDYENTLMSEMGKSSAPTLFQVNGPVGLKNWAEYAYDLKGTPVYDELTSDAYTLKDPEDPEKVDAIAYLIESYGIIVNEKLLKEAGYTTDDIKSFEDLKKVADDIQSRKDDLGFAAFTSAGMDGSSDWRFKTHLANLPIYFEYQDKNETDTDAIEGTYLDNYREIFDLYIKDSTVDGKDLAAKTGDDSLNEFKQGDAVFYQNGSWSYGDVVNEETGLTDDDVTMIPIYIGAGDEATQGLCTGTENYWVVNKDASEEDIQATLDFMYWCVTSEEGTTAMADEMGFVIPFKDAKPSPNVFVQEDVKLTENGATPVAWCFTTMPSEEWKNGVGEALTAYAADPTDEKWEAVESAFVDGWKTEYELANK